MKSTDEMILDLVARGFKLPEHLKLVEQDSYITPWKYWGRMMEYGHAEALCAAAFAWQNGLHRLLDNPPVRAVSDETFNALREGRAEVAIQALWEATK